MTGLAAFRGIVRSAVLVATVMTCMGCRSSPPPVEKPDDPPAYASVAERYNARTAPLERLWARVIVRFTARDRNGNRRTEQGEGYLQVIRPNHVLLSVGSYVDRMYFYLGSNDQLYWWVDSMKDHAREAAVGRLELATRERAAQLGVPVHPLDLLELIGVTTLPESGGEVRWVDRGRAIEVTAPARWGIRRLQLDPVMFEPTRIELLDDAGNMVARAEIALPVAVTIEGSGHRPRIAGRVRIALPTLEAEVTIDIHSPETTSRRPRLQAFDLLSLLESLRIDQIYSLDE